MKVHLHHNHDDVLNGYFNVCMSETDDPRAEIDATVDDAEATEIIANNVLEYVPQAQIVTMLNQIIGKLRHGGELVITGVDAYTVAKDYVAYKLTIEAFNILLHGDQQGAHVKQTTLTLHGLVNFLREQFGLEIVEQGLDEYTFSIKARRP